RDIRADGGHGVYINGQNKDMTGNVPEISLGATSSISSLGNGIYAARSAAWNIAGPLPAPDSLSIPSGLFAISGGTYHSTGDFADPAAANGNGSENTGAALSITSNDGYAKETKVTVTGGTFISDNGYALYEGIAVGKDNEGQDKPAAEASFATLDIKGGSYQGNASKGDANITTALNKQVISG